MNECYNGNGDEMNTLYEKLNTFLWTHPVYKKCIGFLTIALKYMIMAVYPFLLLGFYLQHDSYLLYAIIKPVAVFILVTLIRKYLNRSRPYDYLAITPLIEHDEGCSFPSRHAASAFIIAFTGFHLDFYIGILLLGMAIIIAATRVLSGLHHISDVLGGLLLSIVIELL